MGLGAAVLATAVTLGPSVSVEVVAEGAHATDATALRGWLVQRLIEEGYTIAPSDRADRVLMLRADDDSVSVGSGAEAFDIELGPPAVMRLEALHRSRLLLEHVELTQPVASSVLGIRVSNEAPEGAAGELESALLRAGYVLTPRPRPGDDVLCIVHAESKLGASVARGSSTCPDPTLYVSYATLRGPAGADAIVALLEERPSAVPVDASERPTSTAVVPTEEVEPEAREQRRFISRASEIRLGADAGAVARGDFDGYARVQMRLGKLQGPGGQFHVGVIPSRAGSVRALDTTLAVGPDFRIGRRRVAAEFGLVAGALIHAFNDESERGGSASWYLGLPVSVSFGRKWDGFRGHIVSEAFASGGRLSHIREDAPDWARSAWGLRVGLGFTWGWTIR